MLWSGPKPLAQAPSAFLMLLRKHLQGRAIEQFGCDYPERSLRWIGRDCQLLFEVRDRLPLLLLLDREDCVLGGYRLRRANQERLFKRHAAYCPPPRPDLPSPQQLSAYQLEEIYLRDPANWPQSLLKACFGLSPASLTRIGHEFDRLWSDWTRFWEQTQPGGYRALLSADSRISIWGDLEQGTHPILALELPERLPSQQLQRKEGQARRAKALARLQRRIEKLNGDLAKVGQAHLLQRQGELLLTYQNRVERTATEVELLDWDGQTRHRIAIDPALGPLRQAQKYIKQASKYRRSRSMIEERLALTEREIQELPAEVEVAPAAGAPKAELSGPRLKMVAGFQIYIGRSQAHNEALLRRYAARDDLWFHAKDVPGAHVLLKCAGKAPPSEVVEQAAALAAGYCKRGSEALVRVAFTTTQRVRKPKGSKPGFVVYDEEMTLLVEPQREVAESNAKMK